MELWVKYWRIPREENVVVDAAVRQAVEEEGVPKFKTTMIADF